MNGYEVHTASVRSRVATVLAAAVVVAAGCTTTPAPKSGAPTSAPVEVTYPMGFVPGQIQALDGDLWMTGATGDHCAAERLNPTSGDRETFPLPACGTYLAAGAGHLYLVSASYRKDSVTEDLHLESVDAATGQARIMTPVIDSVQGSGIAHLGFAYAEGSLWLYDSAEQALLEISPATGAVTGKIDGVLSNGGHPDLIAGPSALWMAEGPGGQHLFRVVPGSLTVTTVYAAGTPGAVLWAAAVGDQVWADVLGFSDQGTQTATRLRAFDAAGRPLVTTDPDAVGDSAVAVGNRQLWSVGPGATCGSSQFVWVTDTVTGRTGLDLTLRPPIGPCLDEQTGQIQAVGDYVFILDSGGTTGPPGVLYQIHA